MPNKIYIRRVSAERVQVIQRAVYIGAPPKQPMWQVHEYRKDRLGSGQTNIGAGVWQYQESHPTYFANLTDDSAGAANYMCAAWAHTGWTTNNGTGGVWAADGINNNYPQTRVSGDLTAAPVYDSGTGLSYITNPSANWDAGVQGGTATFSGSGLNQTYPVVAAQSPTVLVVVGDASGEGFGLNHKVTYANADTVLSAQNPNVMKYMSTPATDAYVSKQFTVAAGKEACAVITVGLITGANSRWERRVSGSDNKGVGEIRLLRDFGDGNGYVDVQCYAKIVRMSRDAAAVQFRMTGLCGPLLTSGTPKTAAYHNNAGSGADKCWVDVEVARHLPPGNYELRVYQRDTTNLIAVSRGYVFYMGDPEPTDAGVVFYDEEYLEAYCTPDVPGSFTVVGTRTSDVFAFTTSGAAMFGPQHGFTRQTQTGNSFPRIDYVLSDGTTGSVNPAGMTDGAIFNPGGGRYIIRAVVSMTTQVHEITAATRTGTLTSDGASPTVCTAMGSTAGLANGDLIEIDALRVTDAVANSTTTITSVTGGFTLAMIGKTLRLSGVISGGGGAADYRIISRPDANTITVDRGTGSGTGLTARVLNQNPASGWGGNHFVIGNVDSGTQVTLAAGHVCPAGTGLSWSAATWKNLCNVSETYTYNGQTHVESISVAWLVNGKVINTAYCAMVSSAYRTNASAARPQRPLLIDETLAVTNTFYPFDTTRVILQDRGGNELINQPTKDLVNVRNVNAYRKILCMEDVENGGWRERGRVFAVESDTSQYVGGSYATNFQKTYIPESNTPKIYNTIANATTVNNGDTWSWSATRYWAERDYFSSKGGRWWGSP